MGNYLQKKIIEGFQKLIVFKKFGKKRKYVFCVISYAIITLKYVTVHRKTYFNDFP